MSNRIKIIILISAGTIIVIALLFIIKNIYEQNFPAKEKTTEIPTVVEPKTEEQTFEPSVIQPLTEETKEKNELEKMTFNFIESFGSYSNQSDFQNIEGLKIFASNKMQTKIDNFINEEKVKNKIGNEYYGITTKALVVKNINLKESQAELLINTQRQEAKNFSEKSRTFYQDVLVKLIKQGEEWKVDGIEWKK